MTHEIRKTDHMEKTEPVHEHDKKYEETIFTENSDSTGSSLALFVGIAVFIVLVLLLLAFGLPFLRDATPNQTETPQGGGGIPEETQTR